MIKIKKSSTADTRYCDWSTVTKEQLLKSSYQHIQDVSKGFEFFKTEMDKNVALHDRDKITDIDGFHADFITGFKSTVWWDRHRKINRHHLAATDGIPKEVDLIDVLDYIIDCVMAGMGRTGHVTEIKIDDQLLKEAFNNTIKLLKENVEVVDDDQITE